MVSKHLDVNIKYAKNENSRHDKQPRPRWDGSISGLTLFALQSLNSKYDKNFNIIFLFFLKLGT